MASEGKIQHEEEPQEPEEEQPDLSWLPEGCGPLADGDYDAIIMGTGITECCVGGLLAVKGYRVLQVDRNNYYGGAGASLNLTSLYERLRPGEEPNQGLGADRDTNVDLVSKFLMACGNLVKILLHTKVTRYLDFKALMGSYVLKGGSTYKVPATPDEALRTSLMGFFEKRKFKNLLQYIAAYDQDNQATWKGLDCSAVPMSAVYDKFGVDENTRSFTGHAMALQTDDGYVNRPALETMDAIKLYVYSLERYGQSPYLYPIYGLGGLPEGFSRLCAISGGTFMLSTDVEELLVDDSGVAWGIKCNGNEVARGRMIIGDPSYFSAHPDKVRHTGQVVRSICFMNHPIPRTSDAESAQIILPGRQTGRTNDIYVACVSSAHAVCARGMYIAIVSTQVETDNPLAEVQPGIDLLGPVIERFDHVADLFEPTEDGTADRCFISKSYDGTSHFGSVADDILSLYERITGEQLDMNINADSVEEQY